MAVHNFDRGGISNLLAFLAKLSEQNVHFQIDHVNDDAILVFFTLVGLRVEAEFYVDKTEFRSYRGNEDVEVDANKLKTLIG